MRARHDAAWPPWCGKEWRSTTILQCMSPTRSRTGYWLRGELGAACVALVDGTRSDEHRKSEHARRRAGRPARQAPQYQMRILLYATAAITQQASAHLC